MGFNTSLGKDTLYFWADTSAYSGDTFNLYIKDKFCPASVLKS